MHHIYIYIIDGYSTKVVEQEASNLEDGGTKTLQCNILRKGHPIGTSTTWLHNGQELPKEDRYKLAEENKATTLTIEKISKTDVGDYTCMFSLVIVYVQSS